jgi:predicted kinase
MRPILFVFSGLPGTGKTTLSKLISKYYHTTYFRLDSIEQGLRDLCEVNVQGEGYRLCYRITRDNLLLGNSVVVDCCNPISLTRKEWDEVAKGAGASIINIEITCFDKVEHINRVSTRENDIPNLALPSWNEIEKRHYEKWNDEIICIDTSKQNVDDSMKQLIELIDINIKNFA